MIRKKPNVITSRAIIHAGKGHKYWNSFEENVQKEIESLSKEVYNLLYEPRYKSPLKSLDLPIAHSPISSLGLTILYDIINIANGFKEPDDDFTGEKTIEYLKNSKRLFDLFNSNNPCSLGLHPIIYCYSKEGNFKNGSLYGILMFIKKLEMEKKLKDFIKIRRKFEDFIFNNDELVQQIVRKHRQSNKAINDISRFYQIIMTSFLNNLKEDDFMNAIKSDSVLNYLKLTKKNYDPVFSSEFDSNSKNAVFIRDSLKSALRCPICNCLIHKNSISIDHIIRKQDGGNASIENGQVTHPFCNTGVKN